MEIATNGEHGLISSAIYLVTHCEEALTLATTKNKINNRQQISRDKKHQEDADDQGDTTRRPEYPPPANAHHNPTRPAKHHETKIALQAVEVTVKRGDVLHKTLPLTHFPHDLVRLGTLRLRVSAHLLPVVEHALWECLAAGVGAKVLGEAERLHHGQVRLQSHHRGPRALLLSEHVPTALGEHAVAAAHCVLGARNLAQEDRLQQHGRRREHRRVDHAAGGGHDLAHTTVDGVGVKHHVEEVEPYPADLVRQEHVLKNRVEGGHSHIKMREGRRKKAQAATAWTQSTPKQRHWSRTRLQRMLDGNHVLNTTPNTIIEKLQHDSRQDARIHATC